MSRFPAPLDDFEADDFDIPTFEAPPRRASRPNPPGSRAQSDSRRPTSRPPTSARLAPPRVELRQERDDFEEFEPRPRPSTLSSRSNSQTSQNRPKTSRPAPKNTPRRQNAAGSRAPSASKSQAQTPRALRGVHFQSAGVLLVALGGLLAFNARQTTPDGLGPRLILSALRYSFGIGALALPLVVMLLGLMLLIKRQNLNLRAFWRGAGIAFLTLLTASHLMVPRDLEFESRAILDEHGGIVGGALAWGLRRGLGEVGAIVALGAFALVALLLWSEHTLGELGRGWGAKIGAFWSKISEKWRSGKNEMQARREDKKAEKAANSGDWDEEETEQWDESGDFEIEDAPAKPGRILPFEIAREAKSAKSNRPSPFIAVEDVVGEPKSDSEPLAAAFPSVNTPAIDPDSSLDDPRFVGDKKTSNRSRKSSRFPQNRDFGCAAAAVSR